MWMLEILNVSWICIIWIIFGIFRGKMRFLLFPVIKIELEKTLKTMKISYLSDNCQFMCIKYTLLCTVYEPDLAVKRQASVHHKCLQLFRKLISNLDITKVSMANFTIHKPSFPTKTNLKCNSSELTKGLEHIAKW